MKYGIIDKNGHLNTLNVKDESRVFTNAKGEQQERVVSEEESIELLEAKGYKPVDEIDESKIIREGEEYYFNIPVPYDKGKTIGYRYEKRFDFHKVKLKIEDLKDELSKSDIKITRFYEASIIDANTDANEDKQLVNKRDSLRQEIRELKNLEQVEREKQAKILGLGSNKLMITKT